MIRITAKREGFRRLGIAHPATPTDYPDDRFTKDELQILKGEPMLVVEVVGGKQSQAQQSGGTSGEDKRPNAKDSIELIKAMQTVEEVDAFMVGEERTSVVEAAAKQKETLAAAKE